MVDDTVSLAPEKQGFWRRRSRSLLPIRRFARADARGEGATLDNVRSAVLVMAVGFLLFAVFDTEGIRHFARDLPGNAVSDLLVAWADRWHALMLDLGPARVMPAVRDAFEAVRDLPW